MPLHMVRQDVLTGFSRGATLQPTSRRAMLTQLMPLLVAYFIPGITASLAAWWFGRQRGWSRVRRASGVAVAFGVLCAPGIAGSHHGLVVTSALAILIADPTSSWGYAQLAVSVLIAFLSYLSLSAAHAFVRSRARANVA